MTTPTAGNADPVSIAISRGWRLIKLSKPTDTGPSPGKRPIGAAWQKQPGMSESDAREALAGGYNIGLLCGGADRLIVLDIDGEKPSRLPDTPTVQTGSGGLHLYYRVPDGVDLPRANKCGIVAPGVDVRYTGAQVVYPPSVHAATGAIYEWVDGKTPDDINIAPLPKWVIEAITGGRDLTRYLDAALNGACNDVRHAPQGTRNDTLNARAFHLGTLPFTDRQHVAHSLLIAAMDAGLPESEARATIKSGMSSGMQSPRDMSAPTPASAPSPVPTPPRVAPFRCLGHYRGRYYFLPAAGGQIIELAPSAMSNAANLLQLAPLEWWEAHPDMCNDKGTIKPTAAADKLIAKCQSAGLFDPARIRGRGAWHDDGRIVLHRGNELIVDQTVTPLTAIKSRYVYQREHELDLPFTGALTSEETTNGVLNLCRMLSWEAEAYGDLLAGWIALAPICGVLRWRPHIWITGPSGCGKSYVQDNILPMLGNLCVKVQGCSTEAGIRQMLNTDALAVAFDEAESDGARSTMNIQRVLELARQASSSDGGVIAKGSADGTAHAFNIRSMFCMSSIAVGARRRADQSRITILSLKPVTVGSAGVQQFREIQEACAQWCTGNTARGFIARSVAMAATIRESARVFAEEFATHRTNRRNADQIGTLLAGYWSLRSDDAATADDAKWLCAEYDLDAVAPDDDGADEQQLIDYLMRVNVRVDLPDSAGTLRAVNRTIGELVEQACLNRRNEDTVLQRFGLRAVEDGLFIAAKHPKLEQLLRDTQWATDWIRFIRRMPGVNKRATVRCAAGSVRGCIVPYSSVSDFAVTNG